MGKQKKKKNLSEIISKKDIKKKTVNPFEVHINRQKFNVLGRQMKADRGLPGVAKAKAIKKRKETLLQEYKIQHKSNKFYDKRIGEKNSAMTKEDRIIARFSAERMKAQKKRNIFNLADDEVLTHKGQSIAEIEKFDDPLSDDDDGDVKGLDANFVEEANFGGGTLTESKNNRATIIEQLISESKKRKAERQMAKEKTLQKTEELDAEWKELIPIVNMGRHDNDDVEKKDPYDVILNDLKFEPRGTPSNKLKSETEIAEEEARKLKELEEERLRRMRGEDLDEKPKIQHRSADDLDDGFEIEEESFELAYDKDGNPIGFDKADGGETIVNSQNNSDDSEDDDEEEEDEDSENDEEKDDDDEKQTDSNMDVEDTNNKTDDIKISKETNESSDDDEADDLSDLQVKDDEENNVDSDIDENDKEDSSKLIDTNSSNKDSENKCDSAKKNDIMPQENRIDDNLKEQIELETKCEGVDKNDKGLLDEKNSNIISKETEVGNVNKSEYKPKEKKKVSFGAETVLVYDKSNDHVSKTPEELEKEKKVRKEQMEKARKELPYAFEVPTAYEELQELLKDRTVEHQAVIIERMIKCNHPSLNEKNKEKLENLFAFLMQHLNDSDYPQSWSVLDRLAPHLFDLSQFSPKNAAYCLNEVIFEKHSDYLKKKHKYPSPETLLFLKMVPLLFPTSDRRHSVTTPASVFICEMLHQCHVTTRRAIASGLFIVSLLTEYIWLSKRVMPEALNFLCGIISMATSVTNLLVVPPFKKEHKFLYLHSSLADSNDINLTMEGSDLSSKPAIKLDDPFRVKSVYCALKLLENLARAYEEIPASRLLFEPIIKHLDALEINKYPEAVRKAYSQLNELLAGICEKELHPIVMEAKKPKALRLYEPVIQPVYDSKKKLLPADKAEHTKLLYKYKKEMKGALREIRRDREFLTKLKFKDQAASDAERKRKVKEIYSWGAQQQSEFNKMKRKKK